MREQIIGMIGIIGIMTGIIGTMSGTIGTMSGAMRVIEDGDSARGPPTVALTMCDADWNQVGIDAILPPRRGARFLCGRRSASKREK